MKRSPSPFEDIAQALLSEDIGEAKRLLAGLDPVSAHRPRAAMLMARAALAEGAVQQASEYLEIARQRGADAAVVRRLGAQIRQARNNHAPEIKAASERQSLEQRVAVYPNLTNLQALSSFHARAGDSAAAIVVARQAVALHPEAAKAHRMLYGLLLQAGDRSGLTMAIRDAIESPSPYPQFKQIRITLFGLEAEEAADLKARLIARWPEAAQALELAEVAYGEAVSMALSDQRDTALAYLAQQSNAENATDIEDAIGLIKAMPDPAELKRPIVVDTGEECVISPPSVNGVTVLFFAGLNDRVGLNYEAIDVFCAASGAAAIYLRDMTKMLFLMGVKSLATDRAATIAALRAQLDAMGTRELIVVGSSAGSYSSVTYGLELGAHRIIGLGAQTAIHHFLKPGGDPRAKLMIERIKSMFDPDRLDLRKLWGTLAKPPRLELYFGAENANDAMHANHMAGLDNVFLNPIAGVKRHAIVHSMVTAGTLSTLFDPASSTDAKSE